MSGVDDLRTLGPDLDPRVPRGDPATAWERRRLEHRLVSPPNRRRFRVILAACIGCGACVAACPNGAAHLFAGAKLGHLALLPQPALERGRRARSMSEALEEDFGPCSTYGECAQVCPAGIPLNAVAVVARERLRAGRRGRDD